MTTSGTKHCPKCAKLLSHSGGVAVIPLRFSGPAPPTPVNTKQELRVEAWICSGDASSSASGCGYIEFYIA
jgi:hypothetical protein